MKILIIHRYFWPQPYPYAEMLKYIAEKLSSKHQVSILTTNSGNQKELSLRSKWSQEMKIPIKNINLGFEKKVSIFRKAINSIYFGFNLSKELFFGKTDIVMVATTPPVISAMLVRWISYIKKYKYVYHCQDIHPEAMLLGNNIKKGLIYNILQKIDKKNVNQAWKVITLSNDMKNTIEQRGCDLTHINIINNFIFKSSPEKILEKKSKKIKFLFAGSLGRLQNLNALLDGILLLKEHDDLSFTFLGEGVMLDELKNKADQSNNIEFLGQKNIDEALEIMHSSDVGIISIGNDITKVAYPSKTMIYLGSGLPVLGLVDEDSELSTFINNLELGVSISPTSPKKISNAIMLIADKIRSNQMNKENIKEIAEKFFGKEKTLNQFLEIYS